MEAHYAKVSMLAIVLMVAVASAPAFAAYSVEDNVGTTLQARLCPRGMTSVVYQYGGLGGAGTQVIRCTRGPVVVQTGGSFNTYRNDRFLMYDRFRTIDNYRRHS